MVEIEDIAVADTEQKGPAQIAVAIAHASQSKINPLMQVVVILRYADEDLLMDFSTMTTADLSEMLKYAEIRGNEILRECWGSDEVLETEEDDAS